MGTSSINTVIATCVPTLSVMIGVLINNSRISDLRAHVDQRLQSMETNLKETWLAELRRVEEVLDARLKHLEENL
jgi:hypothetical protein